MFERSILFPRVLISGVVALFALSVVDLTSARADPSAAGQGGQANADEIPDPTSVPKKGREGDPSADYPKDDTPQDNRGSLPPIEPPAAPQLLQYKVSRPTRYIVRSSHKLAIKEREDLKQVYKSSVEVTYSPLENQSRPRSLWYMPPPTIEGEPMLVGVSVSKARGEFVKPFLFGQTERTHQLMRQANFSYQLYPNGQTADHVFHAPSHPLGKSSFQQYSRLASTAQAVFPDRPVAPGSTWTQDVFYRDGEGLAQLSSDAVNTYKFEAWRPCRKSLCAYITITQDVKSAGRINDKNKETRGTSIGTGSGWLLFDYKSGELLKSNWKITSQGSVTALEKTGDEKDPEIKTLANATVLVEYEVTTERVDEDDARAVIEEPVDLSVRSQPTTPDAKDTTP